MWTVKGAGVKADALVPKLAKALDFLGRAHELLFDKPLVVTSANDGKHSTRSKHYRNEAVDLRCIDKDGEEQALFGSVLAYVAMRRGLAVFDERQRKGAPHWHVEVA